MIRTTKSPVLRFATGFAWGCLTLVPVALGQESGKAPAVPSSVTADSHRETATALTNRPDDEKAVLAVGKAFTRSFAAGDARSVGAMFSEDAELIDETGVRFVGRPAIEQFYQALFQARANSTIDIAIDSLRFLSPDVAKEEGHTRVKSAGGPVTLRHYTLLYIKKDGRWLYSSVREEHAAGVAHHEHLKPLEWLLGEWVDQSSESTVHASCRWSTDKNFLLRDYTVHVQGRPVMTVNQRIGWDPLTKQIKSWVFDSEGGYGDGLWTRRGNEWVIKSTGVLPDGRTASTTHSLTMVSPNSARWRSTERTLGDQTIAEPTEYIIVRRAPGPQASRTP